MGPVTMLCGPIFLEFTTGTTDVQRIHNVNTDGTQRQYKASVCYTVLFWQKITSPQSRCTIRAGFR